MPEVTRDRQIERSIITWLYLVVACGLTIEGAYYIVHDLFSKDVGAFSFRGIEAIAGFAVLLLGIVNLLNLSYGRMAVGVRVVAIGANLVLLGLLVWFGEGIPEGWLERLSLLLMLIAAALSVTGKSLLHKSIST